MASTSGTYCLGAVASVTFLAIESMQKPNGVILTKQQWFIQTLRVREVMLTVQLIYGEHLQIGEYCVQHCS